MDQGPLVNEQIDAGAAFLSEFQKYLPIEAAFWLKDSEEGEWNLYVVSSRITDDNYDVAYGEVLRIAGRLRDARFDPFQVKLIGVDDPLAKAALDFQRRYPGRMPTRFHGKTLGGVGVDEAYIYPLPILVPSQQAESATGPIADDAEVTPITRERGSYILLLGPPLVSSRRFVHLAWGGPAGPQSFKVRDYIGGKLLQHRGATPQPEEGFQISESPMSRDEIWKAAQGHIPARGELLHKVQDFPWWKAKLTEMTSTKVKNESA